MRTSGERELEYDVIDGYWADCGESFDSYRRAVNLVAEHGVNKSPTVARQPQVASDRAALGDCVARTNDATNSVI